MDVLPLFPLGTVLLPGAPLPLQVFEPRYVSLLEDLTRQPPERRSFGVLTIRQGHEVGPGAATVLYDVGCEALLEGDVIGAAPPFYLLARGSRRFHLEAIDESAGTPYLTAGVTWLDGEPEPVRPPRELAAQVRAAHARYAAALGAPPFELSLVPDTELAYRVVEHAALPVEDRQSVLEALTAAEQLHTVLQVLRRESALLTHLRAVPGVADPGHASPN